MPPVENLADSLLWTKALPIEISYFIWLSLQNRILTWENLQKKGFHGFAICVLCFSEEETVEHLFINCKIWRMVTDHVCDILNLAAFSPSVSLGEMIRGWIENLPRNSHFSLLPFHMMWIFWKARNRAIFEGEKKNIYSLI